MTYSRQSLAQAVRFEGLGLHSGVPVKVTIHPSDTGIRFRYGQEVIGASPENVSDTTRCTRLGPVSTIEHLMSAFAGLEITDAEVELTASELPGMDGSSAPYVSAFLEAGFVTVGEAELPHIYRRVFLKDGNTEIAIAHGSGHWRYTFETGSRWPGKQVFEARSVTEMYPKEIARARTFALIEEIPMIAQMGLGKGLDETSALILDVDGYKNEARYPDEPVRHKLLDLIGDLYLSGIPVRYLNVSSDRSGHTANAKAAAMLKQATMP
jgi:UDP-3-O-acyl-N-acetylglucosamine deacetylase